MLYLMPTIEPRVNISLDGDTLSLLREISLRTKKSVSAICSEFIRRQIEWDEDAYDIAMIKNLGAIDETQAIPAEDVKKILDALPD